MSAYQNLTLNHHSDHWLTWNTDTVVKRETCQGRCSSLLAQRCQKWTLAEVDAEVEIGIVEVTELGPEKIGWVAVEIVRSRRLLV